MVVQLHPLEFFERFVPDVNRLPCDDLRAVESDPQRLHPEGVRDTVSIDECDRIAACLSYAVVPSFPSGAAPPVESHDGEPYAIFLDDLPGPIRAVRVDHEDLEGRLLRDEAVEEVADVLLLVLHGHDDADQHRRAKGRGR